MSAHMNPFDFGGPVRDPDKFAGRKKELNEINYYLELSQSDRPVYHNIALIGPRAVGKTSLLNMVQHLAESKNMIAIKTSLNEEISANEVTLFKEVFDNLITESAEKGLFGGIAGRLYKAFRETLDRFDTSIDIPFLFGKAYIGYKKGQKTGYSQQVLLHDFKEAYKEVKENKIKTIVLLFDECDLLAQNRSLLQLLRNVFSELDGYILVFCGTDKMFPDFNDVFSPIPRMFKRIDVGNFSSIEDTKECILKPLIEEEKKLVNQGSMAEIHMMSNGNPYEVQLISHFMYRKYKETNSDNIVLDVEVLDNILDELERLRTGGHHEIADRIKRLFLPDQIKIILSTLEFPNGTIDQLAKVIVMDKLDLVDLKKISSEVGVAKIMLEDYIGSILNCNDKDEVSFAGEAFDKLYLKHYAISKGVDVIHFGVPNEIEINLQSKFSNLLLKDLDEYGVNVKFDKIAPLGNQDGYKRQKFIFGSKFKLEPSESGKWTTVLEFSPAEISSKFYGGDDDSCRFRVNVDFINSGFVMQITVRKKEDLEYIDKRIEELRIKLQVLGVEIILEDEIHYNLLGIKYMNEKDYDKAISSFDSGLEINPNFELLWQNKGRTLFDMREYKKALDCFIKWRDLRPRLVHSWERIGATYIHLGKMEEAKKALQKAVELQPEFWVAWDNLGRALYNLGFFAESIVAIDRSLSLNPENHQILIFKAKSAQQLGNFDDAINTWDLVLQSDPKNLGAIINKGISLSEKGNYDLALEHFAKHLKEEPNNKDLLLSEGVVLSKKGLYKKAIDNCSKVLDMDPNNSTALFNRSCFNAMIGNLETVFSDLERAIEIDSNYKELAILDKDFDKIRHMGEFTTIVKKDD